MNDLLRILLERLASGQGLAAATILDHRGSTPRSAGSRMLLATDGATPRILAGSVGGGPVEARVMALARTLPPGTRRVEEYALTQEIAAGAGLICGGRMRLLLERVEPGDLPLWREIGRTLDRGQRALRLVPLDPGSPALLVPDWDWPGGGLDPDLARAALDLARDRKAPARLEHQGRTLVLDPWIPAAPLLVFGAGHVARAAAALAARCGFAVTVLDDRPEFADPARFPGAQVRLLPSFRDCFAGLPAGPESCVAILTRGHLHDAEVLAQALGTRAGYIGMIGSRRKREAVFAHLRGQGFTGEDLARVSCPIGLSIGAETPEEIAVSILAQLIAHRAGISPGGAR